MHTSLFGDRQAARRREGQTDRQTDRQTERVLEFTDPRVHMQQCYLPLPDTVCMDRMVLLWTGGYWN